MIKIHNTIKNCVLKSIIMKFKLKMVSNYGFNNVCEYSFILVSKIFP